VAMALEAAAPRRLTARVMDAILKAFFIPVP